MALTLPQFSYKKYSNGLAKTASEASLASQGRVSISKMYALSFILVPEF